MSRDSSNVYQLPRSRPRATVMTPPRMPPLLADLRDLFAEGLRAQLKCCFDLTDDALFEMANHAGDAEQQNVYLEAMRELRLKRSSVEALFHSRLAERLNGWLLGVRSGALAEEKIHAQIDAETLTLLSEDELEERVAIESMSVRARDRLLQPLDHLSLRLNHLLPGVVGQGHDENPFAPHALCEAFVAATRVLEAGMKAKLVLFKLFERNMLEQLERLYQQINQFLAEAGILPDLKGRGRTAASPQRRPASEMVSTTRREDSSLRDETEDLLASLHDLLARQRRAGSSDEAHADYKNSISIGELANILKTVQSSDGQQHRGFDSRFSAGGSPVVSGAGVTAIWPLIQRLLGQTNSGGQQAIAPLEQDVIHLISMLFEFILNDYNIPEAIKAQLGRLQIPLLRAALLDRGFLNRANHPARRLLNELASASVGLADNAGSRDQLYLKINEVIERVTSEFDTDVTLFQKLLDEFTLFMREERRRTELAEHRLRTAEDGRAKMESARAAAQRVIDGLHQGNRIPQKISALLRDGWSHHLAIIHLKEGEASNAWGQSIETVEELVWSIQPQRQAERMQLLQRLPGLLQRLRDGLNLVAFDPCLTNEFFVELETLHLQICQSKQSDLPMAGEAVAMIEPVTPSSLPDSPKVDAVEEPVPAMQDGAESLLLPSSAETQALLDNLATGSWVEFIRGQERLRCKLVAFIRSADKYIFVNRAGAKVAQKQRGEMLAALAAGELLILDDAQLFDRALTAVIGTLRNASVQELHS